VLIGSGGDRIEMESNNLQIARPICDPHIDEIRLTGQMMQDARWCHANNFFLV
jgi:hypothetical protein